MLRKVEHGILRDRPGLAEWISPAAGILPIADPLHYSHTWLGNFGNP